jgi:type II secretory pathway pseudopilin PulG
MNTKYILEKIKRSLKSKKRGTTLLELIVSIFVFTLAMSMVAGIFASFYNTYRVARAQQQAFEDSSYALNLMSKILRTSVIESPSGTGTSQPTAIRVWDYSTDRCNYFAFSGGNLVGGEIALGTNNEANCALTGLTANSMFAVSGISGRFFVNKTNSPNRVTIRIASSKAGSAQDVFLQTTVSMRNQ